MNVSLWVAGESHMSEPSEFVETVTGELVEASEFVESENGHYNPGPAWGARMSMPQTESAADT